MEIRIDDLRGPEVIRLLNEHLQSMTLYSPPESIHALDLDGLRQADVTFWSVWRDAELLGCGAIKQLDAHQGEIKSMRTSAQHLRQGVGAVLMNHMVTEAKRRSYRRLSLETGSHPGFAPARKLYEQFGFRECGPFADYALDPYSVFMSLEL